METNELLRFYTNFEMSRIKCSFHQSSCFLCPRRELDKHSIFRIGQNRKHLMEGFPLGKAATSPEITRGSFSFLSRALERKKTDKSPREKKRMRERGGGNQKELEEEQISRYVANALKNKVLRCSLSSPARRNRPSSSSKAKRGRSGRFSG